MLTGAGKGFCAGLDKETFASIAAGGAAAILLSESKEQAALIGSPNQIEALRAGMEGRPGRFADGE